MCDQVGGALAALYSLDGVEAAEGARRHQFPPGREIMDGPEVVFCRIRPSCSEVS
ncbi:hypothetical protein [Streptomyces sp. NPDC088755]|uniref:hypothetical protein n=1 Tax=Streptomyces sp. NPDC088755 TaxID=3365888 RepID=UPI00380FE5B6